MVDIRKETIWDITPYTPGKSSIIGQGTVMKLSGNENSFGMSPKAIEAMQKVLTQQHRYPDGGCHALRETIAQHHAIDKDRIVCGAGSDELISLLCDAYAGTDDEVLYSHHGFLMYPIAAQRVGAIPVRAPEADYRTSTSALLAAVTDKTRIVFIANPNNPTGSYITYAELVALREKLPSSILLVIDAAYAEYVTQADYENGKQLVDRYSNVVMTRTFSKIYGMGGLRLGWCYASAKVCDILHRVRGPFNVSAIAQAAGVAAINDTDFIAMSRDHNTDSLTYLTNELNNMDLKVLPSVANFIAVQFPKETAHSAAHAYAYLLEKQIIVRKIEAYDMPEFLRITIGTEEENRAVIRALSAFMQT